MEKFRSRWFGLLLYPDDEKYSFYINYITSTYDYIYILHDKDLDDNGSLKKPHVHCVINVSNAKWNTALSESITIPLNYIQKIRNIENSLDYLIHFNDDSKYQYSLDEVKGTKVLLNKLVSSVNNDGKDENLKNVELLEYISNEKKHIYLKDFALYCAEIGVWDIFRRSALIYVKIIEEHNYKIDNNRKNY